MMSRSAHLPPRCPLQSKPLSPSAPEFVSQFIRRDDKLSSQSCRLPVSSSSLYDEQPFWLDDLLTESDTSPIVVPLRRTCSDSEVILDTLSRFHGSIPPIDESVPLLSTDDATEASEAGLVAESTYLYGPNSPSQRDELTSSESNIVNTVLENVPGNPLQYLALETPSQGNDCEANVGASLGEADPERASKRRLGQRSRVRKLQYIAELEVRVDSLQSMVADLAVKLASQFQLRAALSLENKQIRRLITLLQQEKLIKDGESQSLKVEAERLRVLSRCHRRSRSAASFVEMSPSSADASSIDWQMLDMGKINLGKSPDFHQDVFRL